MDELPKENIIQEEENKDNIIEIEMPYPLYQYLSSQEYDLQKICRVCLSVNEEELIPLYTDKENSGMGNMFMAVFEVQISAEDGLPAKICQRCQTEMISYYQFKIKCMKSDYILKTVKDEFNFKNSSQCNNNLEIKSDLESANNIIINGSQENPDIKEESEDNPVIKAETEHTDIDYLENLEDSISDNETLCIVRDTKNNQKEITIIESDQNTKRILKEVLSQKGSKAKQKEAKNKKKSKHKCKFCSKKFSSSRSMRIHIGKSHEALSMEPECPYPCDLCKETFELEFDLQIHKMLHTQDSNWKCTQCQKLFKDKKSLRRHIMRHMQSKRFQCTVCEASFVEMYALRRHMRVHTGERPEKKYSCTICGEKLIDTCRLREHMARHDGERSHVCACGAAFPSARLLASHRRVHSGDKPHACVHCTQRFRHKSTRNTHQRTHTGERPYVCAQCGKSFIQKSNMTLHMRSHTGERPYSCSICERKFSSGSTLKAHKRTHTGERPYKCKVCGKSFACISLKLHMRLHTGERPFACSACPKRFTTAARLRDHQRLHTGETPFECAMCMKKFTTKSQLISHIKKHEKKQKMGKKGAVMFMPVTVTAESLKSNNNLQTDNKIEEYILTGTNVIPNMTDTDNLCTVQEIEQSQALVYQDDSNIKTEVIVLGNDPNLVPHEMNLVTVNEGEVSISAASSTIEGTTVKLYQYDQSLLQIHTGGGQLIVSRVSSKMTTNF